MDHDETAPDMIALLTGQHRQVEKLWQELQSAHSQGGGQQSDIGQQIVTMLSKHDALETQLLYPELRDVADGDGERLSERSLDDHQRNRELLKQVDGRDFADEDVYSTMAECIVNTMAHVAEEESTIFPLLRQHCAADRLQELGQKMADKMDSAPTHPHPSTPDSKAGAAVAGAVTGLADRARDALSSDD